jgi:hypothetical protein
MKRGGLMTKSQTRHQGDQGWLETEGTEGSQLKQGYLLVIKPGLRRFIVGAKPARAGVRAFIVAKKPGNAGGAKGRRKVNVE